jgi:hypothetical protein
MRKFLGLTVVAVTIFAACLYGSRVWHLESLDIAPPTMEKLELTRSRQVYPYSIVPGGTYAASEMAEVVRRDAVAREHYQDIEFAKVRPMRVNVPMMAYVSYRKGDKVNWTDHPVQIAANEVVMSDGKHLVRARCGNRIEFERPQPLPSTVKPSDPPPPDIVFESPLPGLTPPVVVPPATPASQIAEALTPIAPPLGTPPAVTEIPPTTPPTTVVTPPNSWRPPENPPPPGWKPPSDPPPPGKPPEDPCCDNPPPPPPSPVPEPGTLALVGAGAFTIATRLRKKS